jgi:endoglucanase
MRFFSFLTILISLQLAAADAPTVKEVESGPGGPDHRYGLRVARRVDDQTVRLTFGSSYLTRIGPQAASYRIVSMTDADFRDGVAPDKVETASAPDGSAPENWAGKKYLRHTITLHLPKPLKKEPAYYVQATGGHGGVVTGGRAAMWIEEYNDEAEAHLIKEDRLGVRALELIAPTAVEITLGDGLNAALFDGHPENIALVCADDPDFAQGRKAVKTARRTRGECFHPDGWPWGIYQKHELFAVFDAPLKAGKTYTLDLNASAPLTCGLSKASIAVDDKVNLNPALKASQVGYLPDAPAKYAYLGAWMGALGAFDFAPHAKTFEVRDAASHKVVLSGAPKLRHKSGDKTETAYKVDLSMEDVYELDISALKDAGTYYVAVPGCGRTFDFRIGADVYLQPFRVMMNGVLHQRCGIELKLPYSNHFRPACHRNMTELTDLSRASEQDAFENLPKKVVDKVKHDFFGGHHDAGDYNPRAHLDVAEMAFLAYEIRPESYTDGQLNVPEGKNGVPDILDEGRWALDLWTRLQDEDGGVRNGTESDGDPDQATLAELDNKRDFAFAKDAVGSLRFAGTAAQAALIWEKLGKKEDAADLLKRAVKAWDWAQKKTPTADDAALAAIQLYRATGEKTYLDAYDKVSVFKKFPNAQVEEYNKYNQREASFYYAICSRPVDDVIKQRIIKSFKARADNWVQSAETTAYRFFKNPWAPITWGTGAHPKYVMELMEAYALTKDPNYKKWAALTADWALGCNPMGTVFSCRLGQRCISGPLHMFSHYSPNGPIAGIQCEGPNPEDGGKKMTGSMSTWGGGMLFPAGPWPTLQTYSDVTMLPAMCEGVVADQIRSAIAYGFLLP